VDFKLELLKRGKGHHSLLIKGATRQEEITIINLDAPNFSGPNFIKHTLDDWKPHILPNTVVVGDINTPLSLIGKSSRQKIIKEILELYDTIDHRF
jgi:hypothetical protein